MNALSFVAKFSEKIANLHKNELKPTMEIEKIQQEVKNNLAQNHSQNQKQNGFESQNESNSQKKSTKDDQIDLISSDKDQYNAAGTQQIPAIQEQQDEIAEVDDKSLQDLYGRGDVIQEPSPYDDYDPKQQKIISINRGIYGESQNDQIQTKQKNQKEVQSQRPPSHPVLEDEVPQQGKDQNNAWESYNNYDNQGKPSNEGKNNLGTLSEGRHYDEKFKRAFIKKLSKQIANEHPLKINQAIKIAAHSISVHLYEVKIWMISYKIIFSIEKALEFRGGYSDPAEAMKLIEKEVLSYLQRNRLEKRYRFVKILTYLFQVFNIKDKKASSWLTQFINHHSQELKGVELIQKHGRNNADEESDQVSQNRVKKFRNDKKQEKMQKKMDYLSRDLRMNDEMGQMQEFYKKKPNGQTKVVKRKSGSQMSGQNPFSVTIPQNIDIYPSAFKEKIAAKMNQLIYQSVDEIFRVKSEEFCLSYNTIKTIYSKFGEYALQRRSNIQRKQVQTYLPMALPMVGPPQPMPRKLLSKQPQPPQPPQPQLQLQPQTKQIRSEIPNPEPKKQSFPPKSMVQDERKIQSAESTQNSLLTKLQGRLLAFMKLNQNCHVQSLQQESQMSMSKLGFTEKLKLQVRNQWFCLFLRKHKFTVNNQRRVVCGAQRNISITPMMKPSQPPQDKKMPVPPPPQMNQNPRQIQKTLDMRGPGFQMKRK